MKLVEVIQPAPDVIRLFLEPRVQAGNFVLALLQSLGQEKANNFHNVNSYLESSLGDASQTLEAMGAFQARLEQIPPKAARQPGLERALAAEIAELRSRAQASLVELHRARMKLNDLKAALCRFIIQYEASGKAAGRAYNTVEEWMDAAALAEMRLARNLAPEADRNLQRLLALFMTFRSIVCSYDGPSMYIRQTENMLASVDAIYERLRLEMEVLRAQRTLVETRRELSTAKNDLTSLRHQLEEKQSKDEQLARLMSLQEKSSLPQLVVIGICLVMLSALMGFWLMKGARSGGGDAQPLSQRSCRDIERQLEKSPRYRSQVLIFRKFGREIFFRANAMTCEKLYRLDSAQIGSLSDLLKADYAAGAQAEASYNGNRVLQVKDVGRDKLVVKLQNRTDASVPFKLQVLEKANLLRAVLQTDPAGQGQDLLIVELARGAPD